MYQQDKTQTWDEMKNDSTSDVLYMKCEMYEGTIQTIAVMLDKLKEQINRYNHGRVLSAYVEDIIETIRFAETGTLVFKAGEH